MIDMLDHNTREQKLTDIGIIRTYNPQCARKGTPQAFSDQQLEFLAKPVSELAVSDACKKAFLPRGCRYIYQLLSWSKSDVTNAFGVGGNRKKSDELTVVLQKCAREAGHEDLLAGAALFAEKGTKDLTFTRTKAENEVFDHLGKAQRSISKSSHRPYYTYYTDENFAQKSLDAQVAAQQTKQYVVDGLGYQYIDEPEVMDGQKLAGGLISDSCLDKLSDISAKVEPLSVSRACAGGIA